MFEQIVDVRAGRRRMRLVQVPVGVRRADDPVPPPRDDEEHGLLGAQDQAGGGVDAVLRDDQVDALGRPDVELAALTYQRLGVIRPDAGGVDHLFGPDLVLTARLDVLHPDADDPLALPEEADHPGPVRHVRPVPGGGPHQRRHIAGVVHLGVVVLQGAHQGVPLQRGRDPQGLAAGEVPVHGQSATVPGRHRHRVVQRDTRTGVQPLPALVLQGVEERHRLHQVRGQPLQQQPALLQCLPDEREVEHLQIAQPAVDQLARPARRAGRPVARLDQAGRKPSRSRVECRPGADHARPHDQHVQFALGHRLERLHALRGSQCRCPHCCLPVDRGGPVTGMRPDRGVEHLCPSLDSVRAPRLQPPAVDNTRTTRTAQCDI